MKYCSIGKALSFIHSLNDLNAFGKAIIIIMFCFICSIIGFVWFLVASHFFDVFD